VLYYVGQNDVRSKRHLKTGEKFYPVDVGLCCFLLGSGRGDVDRVLENVVYLELLDGSIGGKYSTGVSRSWTHRGEKHSVGKRILEMD
jgi:predicted AAA+ superfamily ATPase